MSKNTNSIFVICGEKSGERHASSLLKKIKSILPELHIQAVASLEMKKEVHAEIVEDSECLQVMGFKDVFLKLPQLICSFFKIKKRILENNPQAVLLMDSPDFNLRMAKSLRKAGYQGRLIYYVCPSIWAWRAQRKKILEKNINLLLCIFPFETKLFQTSALKSIYAGNPSFQQVHEYLDFQTKASEKFPSSEISLFPGSRLGEIQKNLPLQLESLYELSEKKLLSKVHLSLAKESLKKEVSKHVNPYLDKGLDIKIYPPENRFDLMKRSYMALSSSGTVNLELALFSVPTVCIYVMDRWTQWILKYLFSLKRPFYCLPNIILNKEVFPELIEQIPKRQNIIENILQLQKKDKYQQCLNTCQELIQNLAPPQERDIHEIISQEITYTSTKPCSQISS